MLANIVTEPWLLMLIIALFIVGIFTYRRGKFYVQQNNYINAV